MRIIVTFLRPLLYFAVRSGRFTHDAYLLTHEVKGSAWPKAALYRGAQRNPLTVWHTTKTSSEASLEFAQS